MSKDNKTLYWLKRIFSVSTLTTLIALGSLVIAYITYESSTSGELTIKVHNEETELTKTDYSGFAQMYLVDTKDTMIHLYSSYLHLPVIKNNTNRTVRNLKFEVKVTHCDNGLLFPNEDFIEKDNNVYRYKYNYLEPYESICFPFSLFYTFEYPNYLDLLYDITYEGINGKFLRFCTIHFYPAFNNNTSNDYILLRNDFIHHYLGSYIEENPSHKADNFILTIGDTTIVNPITYKVFDEEYNLYLDNLEELMYSKGEFNWYFIFASVICLIFLVSMIYIFIKDKLYDKNNLTMFF